MTPRQARARLEAAIDEVGWPWSLLISRWIDCLLVAEENW